MKFTLFIFLLGLLIVRISGSGPESTTPSSPTYLNPSDQVGKTIWRKSDAGSSSVEQVWISAHRPTTGIVTILHERRDASHGGRTTRTWATYDLAPGEAIHLSCAIGSDTKIVIVSETVPKGVVKVTATEQ